MKIEVHNTCPEFDSFRAARVQSMFNADAEQGRRFDLEAELDIDDDDWSIGIVVGPSGSGKTSIGRELWDGDGVLYEPGAVDWPGDQPIIDAIAPGGDFDSVTGALAGVGLGTVPSWLRPYRVLSNGEKFRADLARLICEPPERLIIDEFTSVVDRQIARFGALAFQKAWRRVHKKGGNQCVLLSCHYDILEWVEPDWVFDTKTGAFTRGRLRRPRFDLEVWQTDWRYWHLFEPHHYLKLPKMIGAKCYVGVVEGELVSHLGVSTIWAGKQVAARACRLVVMPEWQGAGVGLRFLNHIGELMVSGDNPWGRRMPMYFHTTHPGLVKVLRRYDGWVQTSARLYGTNKAASAKSITAAGNRKGIGAGYGGHFRAVQGFKYVGMEHTS